jgi:sialate O-acetylesterase
MRNRVLFAAAMLLTSVAISCVRAGVRPATSSVPVKLASPFTDHMVLQRDMSVPVWGTAGAGQEVTVRFNGQTVKATANAAGHWTAKLAPMSAGGPREMKVAAGGGSVKLADVYVGEVWLCSGQSNMDFTLDRTPRFYFAGARNATAEIAAAKYPKIRMFSGFWTKAYEPQATIEGTWKICTPKNAREFSAIGYFFARDLQKALGGVPVGILTETYGASTAEAWIRREALESVPELKPMLDRFDAKVKAFPQAQHEQAAVARKRWRAALDRAEATSTTMPRGPRGPRDPDPVQDQHNPTVMYNGMIAPVVPYAIRGVLWYQGESIVGGDRGIEQYPLAQATLIRDWRKLWNEGEIPFYIVQLAAYHAPKPEPASGGTVATTREAQATVLALPATGMAATIDIGDARNIHPKNKQDVGDRLTRIALANVYGRKIEFSGPIYQSMAIEGKTARLKFGHVGAGLEAKGGGDLKQFAIAGKDGKFVAANAKIDGDTVVAGSPEVAEPVAVRYAWADNPEGANLFNKDGLPAPPFRADAPIYKIDP